MYLRYGIYHVQPHLHGAVGMVGSGLGQTGHAVVAVSQQLDPQAVVFVCKAIKPVDCAVITRYLILCYFVPRKQFV